MEQRLANRWRMSVNEKKFIETAMQSDLRIDGCRPFDFRHLTIKFEKMGHQRDPYSKGIDSDTLKASLAPHGTSISDKKQERSGGAVEPCKAERDGTWEGISSAPNPIEAVESRHQTNEPNTLKDAVKRKKRKNKVSIADQS